MSKETKRAMTIVTGASEGLGLELARCFASGGNDVMMVARAQEPLRRQAERISSRYGVEAVALALDVTAPDAPEALDGALHAQSAYADVVVNNAGIGLSGAFVSHDCEAIERLLQLNVMALNRLMRHFLPAMISRGHGGILNVASLGGLAPGPYQAAYYASKAYVMSLSEAVAAEVRHQGVHVAVLAPGPIATKFHGRMGSENDWYYRWLPVLTASEAARSGYRGFLSRRRVIIPGVMNNVLALALRITPNAIVSPIVGLLLRPRA